MQAKQISSNWSSCITCALSMQCTLTYFVNQSHDLLQGARPFAKVQSDVTAKQQLLNCLQADNAALSRQKDEARKRVQQLQQQYSSMMDAARAEGTYGSLLTLQDKLAALQEQCKQVSC